MLIVDRNNSENDLLLLLVDPHHFLFKILTGSYNDDEAAPELTASNCS
jgi:hypothetical protein